jgi:hypothetical protein
MPIISPTPGDVHVNGTLTNVSLAYMQNTAGFVADKVFPGVPVAKQSDIYWVWPRDAWNRDEMKVRAPGAQTAGTNFTVAQAPYYAEVKGLHHPIPDQVIANADSPIMYDAAATNLVTRKAMINRENGWIGKFFSAGVWTLQATGNATATAAGSYDPTDGTFTNNRLLFWNNAASTPIEDMRKAMTYVQLRSGGFRPTKLTMSRLVADVLFDHPEIVARVNGGQTPGGPAVSNEAVLARILGLSEVLVMDGIVNAAKEGLTESNAFFGGKHALLSYSPATPSLMEPSAGYTFNWTGYLGATQNGTRIKRFYMVAEASTWVEVETAYDQRLTSAEMAFFFYNIIQ